MRHPVGLGWRRLSPTDGWVSAPPSEGRLGLTLARSSKDDLGLRGAPAPAFYHERCQGRLLS